MIQIHRLKDLLTAEGQELASERPGPVPRCQNRPYRFFWLLGREIATQKHFAVTRDDGQQVVEIVGNPAGKLAERFHLLSLTELLLELLPVVVMLRLMCQSGR